MQTKAGEKKTQNTKKHLTSCTKHLPSAFAGGGSVVRLEATVKQLKVSFIMRCAPVCVCERTLKKTKNMTKRTIYAEQK